MSVKQNCLQRIRQDLKAIYDEPPPGIFAVPDENDFTLIHALVTGAFDTPYEGGFFYFLLKCPAQYPLQPPKVTLKTTGGGYVAFNQYMFSSGHVCLSILGTTYGPQWSSKQTLSTLLLSIQSLLNENPYFGLSGYKKDKKSSQSDKYNLYLRHETLRVAVCNMLEENHHDSKDCPAPLRHIMEKSFLEYYEKYVISARSNLHLDKETMYYRHIRTPVLSPFGVYNFDSILKRLEKIKTKLEALEENM